MRSRARRGRHRARSDASACHARASRRARPTGSTDRSLVGAAQGDLARSEGASLPRSVAPSTTSRPSPRATRPTSPRCTAGAGSCSARRRSRSRTGACCWGCAKGVSCWSGPRKVEAPRPYGLRPLRRRRPTAVRNHARGRAFPCPAETWRHRLVAARRQAYRGKRRYAGLGPVKVRRTAPPFDEGEEPAADDRYRARAPVSSTSRIGDCAGGTVVDAGDGGALELRSGDGPNDDEKASAPYLFFPCPQKGPFSPFFLGQRISMPESRGSSSE